MDSRALAALLSSLVSQLTLLLILLFPSPLSPHSPHSHSLDHNTLFSLIHNSLSATEIISLLALSRRKRARTHIPELNPEHENPTHDPKLGQLGRLSQLVRVNSELRDPDSFRVFFKMGPSTFDWLSGLLEPLLECRDPVDSPLNLSAELRLGIGLYRLTAGSDYPEIATRFRVTDRVAKFCSKQLCRVLCTNFRFWVGFPNSDEFDLVSKNFENLTGLPNCCGVIGSTKFKIIRPNNNPNNGLSSDQCIAAQIVVDSSCRILSIFAGSSGDKSNLRVLKSSALYKDVVKGRLLNSPPYYVGGVAIPQYLVGGNKGYPLLPWLIVPFDDPKHESNEEKFNAALGLMRVPMLKTVASLKNWGILSKPVEEDLRNVVAYIGACAILHNALLLREDFSSLCDRVEDNMVHDHVHSLEDVRGSANLENSIEGRVIRNALATKVKELSRIK